MAESHQPGGKTPMSIAREAGTEYVTETAKDLAKEKAEETAEYIQGEDGQQRIDEAKEQAQGMWAKYCGCLSSV